jgi:hypothetical protein
VLSCRLFNTALDFICYNVPILRAALAEKDAPMQAGQKAAVADHRFRCTERPGGVTAPHRREHYALCAQISECEEIPRIALSGNREVDIATITGVGSSAPGSAALAWDVSVALKKPVPAIVPGYGVADAVLRGLGGFPPPPCLSLCARPAVFPGSTADP